MRQSLGVLAMLLVLVWAASFAAEHPDKSKGGNNTAAKGTAGLSWSVLTINNLWTWHRSDGEGNHSPGGEDGMGYPAFTARAVYEDNMVFGGRMYVGGFPGAGGTLAPLQPTRINGGTYLSNHGMVQGWVEGTGATANYTNSTNDPKARIYRIRRDYTEMSASELKRDASIVNEQLSAVSATQAMVDAVKAAYATDWDEWPTQYGAPYIDRNGNGVYDAPPPFSETFTVDSLIAGNGGIGYDEPGVAGADQTTPADQVLYTVYHGLDRTKTLGFEGSEPIGVEVQKTVWGYKRTDALGNVYFTRYRLINKGGIDIGGGTKGTFYLDSMFLCEWSDIDLGNAGDDLVGSDSVLSMGYVFNGNATDLSYQRFNLPPPSSGYDFLGGPTVSAPGDSAIFNFKRVYGKKNQAMSSFAFFSAGSPFSDPPFGDYDRGSGRWWAMLRGFAPVGTMQDAPTPYPHPPGMAISRFPYSGNPSLPEGTPPDNFIDGLGTTYSFSPGDRRILVNTGPFQMAPNDTQDIYMGFVVGIGGDRLSSVAVMKAYDLACQETFNLVFKVAKPPKNPTVKVTELDGEILLDWSYDQATIKDTEGRVVQPGAYTFEGYNLYQFPSVGADVSAAVRIATYDVVNNVKTVSDLVFDPLVGQFVLKPVQFGNDNGVSRFVSIKNDFVRDIPKMYNGQEYYFAVTAYSRATLTGYTAALESAPNIITVRPKVPFGKELVSATGDTVTVARTGGASDGSVQAFIADPLAITGDTYEVRFTASQKWGVFNVTKNTWAVDTSLTNQSGDANYPVIDGMTIKAVGPPNDVKDFQHTAGPSGAISPATYAAYAFNSSGFPTPTGADRPAADWGGGQWGVHTNPSASDLSFTYFKSRVFRGTNFSRFIPYDFEMRFTAGPNRGILYYTNDKFVDIPFELWNIGIGTPTNTADDYRMIPWILDEDGDDAWGLSGADHSISGGDNDPYTDWIYWMDANPKTPGQSAYDAFAADSANYATGGYVTGTGGEVMARFVLVTFNSGSVADVTFPANVVGGTQPATGNVIRIISTKPNTPSDLFSINTAAYAPTANATLAKASANKVGVFPNPYYTQNGAEVDRYDKFVTFNNLPQKATIKIFNLAGHLVRTLEKDDASQFVAWDLVNEKNFPVASGIYICRVDMPEVGVTKIVKLAVIMEQEILDIF